MNPSLWDVSRRTRCDRCGIETRVDDSLLRRCGQLLSSKSERLNIQCWHCGVPISETDVKRWLSLPLLPPQTIRVIRPTFGNRAGGRLYAGELVVVMRRRDKSNQVHVKRVLATPGQTVSTDESGRLLVNGQRPHFNPAPRVLVDRDDCRAVSRWQAEPDASSAPVWQRTNQRAWISPRSGTWLTYHHQSVYRSARPMPVQDDYPSNLGIQRRLYQADGLSVEFELVKPTSIASSVPDQPGDSPDFRIDVAFWTDGGVRLCQTRGELGEDLALRVVRAAARQGGSLEEPIGGLENPPDLSSTRPIAIRLRASSVWQIRKLVVRREVLYRITHPSQNTLSTPLVLQQDQWFVVGDNVPLSVDSRTWGCVHRDEIVGQVARTD